MKDTFIDSCIRDNCEKFNVLYNKVLNENVDLEEIRKMKIYKTLLEEFGSLVENTNKFFREPNSLIYLVNFYGILTDDIQVYFAKYD